MLVAPDLIWTLDLTWPALLLLFGAPAADADGLGLLVLGLADAAVVGAAELVGAPASCTLKLSSNSAASESRETLRIASPPTAASRSDAASATRAKRQRASHLFIFFLLVRRTQL